MEKPLYQPDPEVTSVGQVSFLKKNMALHWARAFVWLSPMGALILTLVGLFLFRRLLGSVDEMTILVSALGFNVLFAGVAGICEAFLQGRRRTREIIGVAVGFLFLQFMLISSVCAVVERFFRI